jgi:anti-sigma regulatory factor (Ser/Thr protein kinase)
MEAVTLPADATSPSVARSTVRGALVHIEDGIRDAVVLMTSELVANVIRHANTEVRVNVDLGPPVRVEVHDGVAAQPLGGARLVD